MRVSASLLVVWSQVALIGCAILETVGVDLASRVQLLISSICRIGYQLREAEQLAEDESLSTHELLSEMNNSNFCKVVFGRVSSSS